jgi:hypothetical protein
MSPPEKTRERLVSCVMALLFVIGMSCLTTLAAHL